MTDAGAAGLYIHVPFCSSKCPYCDFFSITAADMVDAWCTAVCRELDMYRGLFPRFETVYFGGGTPSLLSEKQLAGLMAHVNTCVEICGDSECTIEVNPDDLTRDKARALHGIGFNRLSIGVQSFDERVLRFLGRRHTARQALDACGHAAAAGFSNISIDLMYGLPDQTWQAELKQAVRLRPAHLSCYQLTIKPGTPFYERQQAGSLAIPSDEELAEFFLLTDSYLAAAGYGHYEVSSFARSPDHASRHNSRYWRHVPYLGLGPCAHSFDGQKRWWNSGSVQEYCRALSAGMPPVAGEETLAPEQLRLERLMLGLRTGCGAARGDVTAGKDMLEQLERDGLITVRFGSVAPTVRGMLVADHLAVLLGE